jgi:trk system potassium uptake protein TrkH
VVESRKNISHQPQDPPKLNTILNTVTARTAGFSTMSMAALATPTALLIVLLMFIGASPGGTGGGIKTSTMTVLVATLRSILRGRPNVEFLRRGLPQDVVNKAVCVVLLGFGLVFASTVIISIAEGRPLMEVLFEAVSAFGTVGLSRGITGDLTMPSKIVIIMTMFFGRIGPLTLGLAIGQRTIETSYSYPVERVMIG